MVTTRIPRIVTEYLLTRMMLIKCMYMLHVFTIDFAYELHVFYLSEKQEYEFITTIIIEFEESFQCLVNTLVLFTYLDVRARLSISDLRLPSDRRTMLIGTGHYLAIISSPGGVSI